jgi:hypothetical protein
VPIWVEFGQFGKISANFGVGSAKISGGDPTARIRPFLNECRPFWPKTKLLCSKNRQISQKIFSGRSEDRLCLSPCIKKKKQAREYFHHFANYGNLYGKTQLTNFKIQSIQVFSGSQVTQKWVHRQFTANNSPQKKVGQFTAEQFTPEAIHRRGHSPQSQFTTRQFTARTIHRKK